MKLSPKQEQATGNLQGCGKATIVIINDDGSAYTPMLCKDGRWRTMPLFGTYRSCAKIYRSLGHAIRRADAVGGQVVQLPPEYEINGCRVISRTPSETKPGYEVVHHHRLTDFVVWRAKASQ